MALGGDAAARKRKRKPKTKPKPPLVFVAMTATDVALQPQGGFTWTCAMALQHPGSGFADDFSEEFDVPATFSDGQSRAEIVRQVQKELSLSLAFVGIAAAPDRIAVPLL